MSSHISQSQGCVFELNSDSSSCSGTDSAAVGSRDAPPSDSSPVLRASTPPSTALPPPNPSTILTSEAAQLLLHWFFRTYSARNLPWRSPSVTPYAVYVCEVMSQQTRLATVIPYFHRFMKAFPSVDALAAAEEAEVMQLWSGLGYYRRARQLHAAAKAVARARGVAGRGEDEGPPADASVSSTTFSSCSPPPSLSPALTPPRSAERCLPTPFPSTMEALLSLPGVGPYTAAAVASIGGGEIVPAVDGNVLRVVQRVVGGDAIAKAALVVSPVARSGKSGKSVVRFARTKVSASKTPGSRTLPHPSPSAPTSLSSGAILKSVTRILKNWFDSVCMPCDGFAGGQQRTDGGAGGWGVSAAAFAAEVCGGANCGSGTEGVVEGARGVEGAEGVEEEAVEGTDVSSVLLGGSSVSGGSRRRHLKVEVEEVQEALADRLTPPTNGTVADTSSGAQAWPQRHLTTSTFGASGAPPHTDGPSASITALSTSTTASSTSFPPLPVHPGLLNEALMELGSTVCTPKRPQCGHCPLQRRCVYATSSTHDPASVESPVGRAAGRTSQTLPAIVPTKRDRRQRRLASRSVDLHLSPTSSPPPSNTIAEALRGDDVFLISSSSSSSSAASSSSSRSPRSSSSARWAFTGARAHSLSPTSVPTPRLPVSVSKASRVLLCVALVERYDSVALSVDSVGSPLEAPSVGSVLASAAACTCPRVRLYRSSGRTLQGTWLPLLIPVARLCAEDVNRLERMVHRRHLPRFVGRVSHKFSHADIEVLVFRRKGDRVGASEAPALGTDDGAVEDGGDVEGRLASSGSLLSQLRGVAPACGFSPWSRSARRRYIHEVVYQAAFGRLSVRESLDRPVETARRAPLLSVDESASCLVSACGIPPVRGLHVMQCGGGSSPSSVASSALLVHLLRCGLSMT